MTSTSKIQVVVVMTTLACGTTTGDAADTGSSGVVGDSTGDAPASTGHDMCAEDPWISGLQPEPSYAAPLHPYAAEQKLVADLLTDLLRGDAAPTPAQPSDH